jgi:hypothetical protein
MPIPSDTGYSLTHDVPGIDPYTASAFQRLRQLNRIQEAEQKFRIQQLSSKARRTLDAEAAVILPSIEQDPLRLIRAKKWRAAIALLEARVAQSSSTLDRLLLPLAYWGAGNESRAAELCRPAIEFMLEGDPVESCLEQMNTNEIDHFPLLSLLFWRAGDSGTAKRFLDRCEELLTEASETDAYFSVWRFRHVTRRQFGEDCHAQRQMIQGAGLRPYFLGKEPGGA